MTDQDDHDRAIAKADFGGVPRGNMFVDKVWNFPIRDIVLENGKIFYVCRAVGTCHVPYATRMISIVDPEGHEVFGVDTWIGWKARPSPDSVTICLPQKITEAISTDVVDEGAALKSYLEILR